MRTPGAVLTDLIPTSAPPTLPSPLLARQYRRFLWGSLRLACASKCSFVVHVQNSSSIRSHAERTPSCRFETAGFDKANFGCSGGLPCPCISMPSYFSESPSRDQGIPYLFSIQVAACGAPRHRATIGADGEDHGLIDYTCSLLACLLACLPAVHGGMTFS